MEENVENVNENENVEKTDEAVTTDENVVENKNVKKKRVRNAIFKVLDVVVLLMLVYFIIGYVNFYKITNDKKPLFTISEKSYNVENGKVKVYHNGLYKIVEHEVTDVNKTYSLKLWFMKDVK